MPEWKEHKLIDLSIRITKGTTPTTIGLKFSNSGINFIKAEAFNYSGRIDKNSFNFIDEETPFENIHFYGYLRNIDENEFESQFLVKTGITDNSQPFTQYEKELVTQIIYNSRIAWLKYQLFKIGAFILLCNIAMTIVLYPITTFILWSTKLLF